MARRRSNGPCATVSVVGALGLLGWMGTIRAARAGKRWTFPLAIGLLGIALCVAIAALTVRDTSGDVGPAPLLGWLLVLPCVPGLAAVVLAVTHYRGADFLVSMLGPDASWVRDVEAAGGKAALRRQGRECPILLEEIPSEHRAQILRRYLAGAPGARPHLGLGPTAPLPEFHRIAPRHPVFRIHERPAPMCRAARAGTRAASRGWRRPPSARSRSAPCSWRSAGRVPGRRRPSRSPRPAPGRSGRTRRP